MNKKDCYWYSEYKDMNATIPYCRYYKQDECECTYFCDHYISQKYVDEALRILKGDITE